MEAAGVLQSPISICIRTPKLEKKGSRSSLCVSNLNSFIGCTSKFHLNKSTSLYHAKLGVGKLCSIRKSVVVRASASSNSSDSMTPIAPLELESPVGQFLSQILVSHPHLLPAAVEQQLEQLETDREAEKQNEEPFTSNTDLVLYRRIAEVKANERKKVLEEILYALVVQKFMDANISLIPCIASSSNDPTGPVDVWPCLDRRLEEAHSPEAYEMIENHLALILGNQSGDSTAIAEISKFRVGQVYAASVMFGYFLKRIDQRFQLEKTMKTLPEQRDGRENEVLIEDVGPMASDASASYPRDHVQMHPEDPSWDGDVGAGGLGDVIKPCRLRSYVMTFDNETLARFATIRSKEAVSIVEKHTEALFGKPQIGITPQGTVDSSRDEQIKIRFGGLKRLVLEAVTFGSFLWEVESYVDTRYHLLLN